MATVSTIATNSINCSNFVAVQKHDLVFRQRDDTTKTYSDVGMGVLVSLDVYTEDSVKKIPFNPVTISREVRLYQVISIPLDVDYDSPVWDSSTFYLQLYIKPDKPIPVQLEQLWQRMLKHSGSDSINVGILYFGPLKSSTALIRSKYLQFNKKLYKVFKCTIISNMHEIMELADLNSKKRPLVDDSNAPAAKKFKTDTQNSSSSSSFSNSGMPDNGTATRESNAPIISEQLIASKHYNELQREQANRHLSLIYHLRSLNNVLKAELINFAMSHDGSAFPLKVIDYAAGKGGDLNKWFKDSGRSKRYCDLIDFLTHHFMH